MSKRHRARSNRQPPPSAAPPAAARAATTSAPAPPRLLAALLAAIAVAAFFERWWFPRAWGEQASLSSVFYYGDAPRFVSYAIAILKGLPFDNGIPFHPPGWPLFLAAFLRLSGAVHGGDVVVPVAAVHVLLAAVSALAVTVTARLAGEIAGPGAMIAAGLLGAFNFGHIVEGTVPNAEALYSLGVAVFMWLSWQWLRKGSPAWAAAAGAAAGLTMIVRAEFLAAVVVLVAAFAWTRSGERRRAPVAVFLVTFAAALVPTTVWHWRTLSAFNTSHVGRVAGPLPVFAPVTSYGPFNFAMANHEDADGGPNRDHPLLDACSGETDARLSAGELDLACPQVYDLYVHGYRFGAAWLIDNPGRAWSLMGRKIAYTIGFLGHGYFIDDVGAGVTGTRRRVDLVDSDATALIPIHLLLVAAGLYGLWRRPLALWTLAAPLAALAGAVLLFYGYVRLGVAYLPPIWILEGAGIAVLLRRLGLSVRPRTAILATVIALAVALTYERAHLDAARPLVRDGTRTAAGALVEDETMRIVVR